MTHDYLQVAPRLFVSLEHNPVTFAFHLRRKRLPFGSSAVVRALARYRVGRILPFVRDGAALVRLPFTGHLAFARRHAGYKVFDLHAEAVRTYLDDALPLAEVETQIALARTVAANCRWAPAFLGANARERWFDEAYIKGHRYQPRLRPAHAIDGELLDALAGIVTALPPRPVRIGDYLDECAGHITALWRRLEAAGDRSRILTLSSQIDRVLAAVRRDGPETIHLALSHGDLVARNILTSGTTLVCVDWEGADYRSALYDLHYFSLRYAYDSDRLDATAAVLKRSGAALREHLGRHASGRLLVPDTHDAWLCHWLFIVEWLVAMERSSARHAEVPALPRVERWVAQAHGLEAAIGRT